MSSQTSVWKYEVNDLVWAKMKGFPPWPGRVVEPTEPLKKMAKKNSRCIFFYGSDNFAWIEIGCLKPYFEFKDTLTYSCKTLQFKDACKAIEQYIHGGAREIKNNGISESESQFESLIQSGSSQSAKKKVSIAARSTPHSSAKRRIKVEDPQSSFSESNDSKTKLKKKRINSSIDDTAKPSFFNNLDLGVSNPNHLSPIRKTNSLLDRPEVKSPEIIPLDINKITQTLLNKKVVPSTLRFGFLGLGNMGSGIVKNLLNSGHKVTVWNRTVEKIQPFEAAGASLGLTPSDVIGCSDITFSCVADPQVAKDMVFGNCGVLSEINPSKGFVEMSGIDPETSQDINEAITSKGGRYLEAMVQGSKEEAEEGTLICMAGGNRSLFDECETCFSAMTKNTYYLGDVGSATKMNLILHSVKAVAIAGLAEGMALADRAGVPHADLLNILDMTSLQCSLLSEKGKAMKEGRYRTHQALKHLQKDLNLSLNWADTLEQPCPVTASVNEIFKHAKRLGYSDHDTSAVYVRAKF